MLQDIKKKQNAALVKLQFTLLFVNSCDTSVILEFTFTKYSAFGIQILFSVSHG